MSKTAAENTQRRTLSGVVVSNKMDKTVSVAVARLKTHPLYRKRYKITKKFLAHDEDNKCQIGDKVEISETRPLSKNKRFEVVRIVAKEEIK
ncbi:MAG: 30S ribosomal protein S17 [Candidatus Saccharimonadales bacterium]